ncbi:MAG: glutamate--cysteine ligase, partial [Pseudomonadota bacterium]|nr:glutamate--cysteine ligase [Pseudomonadota bacterium]
MSLSIKELKSSGAIYELNNISRGIEKEGLRVSPSGEISKNNHPNRLGSALTNPYLTTDFSEALLELITPVFNMPSECLDFLSEIHSFVIDGIEDELIWPFSMPPSIDTEEDVRIGSYGKSNSGMMKTIYRRGLANRYGRKMQAIAGIHYNFSFSDAFFEKLDSKDVQNKKNEVYLSIARNFKRQEWL